MNYTPAEYAKAIVGAVLAGLTALGTAMASGGVSAVEWIGVAIAVVATFGAVFGVSNKPRAQHRREVGAISGDMVLNVALGVFIGGGLLWLVIYLFERL